MGLDVAFIKHGLTLNNHGRPVTTLIDKEMDRMKLVRQEMEWEIQSDREMDWSNRHIRELKEEKLQASILASPRKQIEESHKTEPEPTTLCLKLEEEAEVAEAECGHVPDQIKQEEKVPGGSSKALELVLPTVEQGDNFKSLACELLIRPLVCLQLSLVEHLRVVKGLQQVVFEPGGSFSVSIRSNNNLFHTSLICKVSSLLKDKI
ncbi:hypothetical protein YC2023_089253 [Brassica napus]